MSETNISEGGRFKNCLREPFIPSLSNTPNFLPQIDLSSVDELIQELRRSPLTFNLQSSPSEDGGSFQDGYLPYGWQRFEGTDFIVSGYSEDNEKSPSPPNESWFQKVLRKYDFQISGMGEAGRYCGSQIVSGFGCDGDRIFRGLMTCKRVECPECHRLWEVETTFNIAVQLEAYARYFNERPHALTWSVHPSESSNYTWKDFNLNVFKKGYREAKKLGVVGGCAIFHPYRVKEAIKRELAKLGYGNGKNTEEGNAGHWKGVKADALGYGDFRSYVKLGPHVHSVGFPEWIEQHEDKDFVIKKYASLESMEDVVRHVRYLVTHAGIVKDDITQSIRFWGCFHASSKNYFNAKDYLGEWDYEALCKEIANIMGMKWDWKHGLHHLGEVKPDDFVSIHRLGSYLRSDWVNELPEEFVHFWQYIWNLYRYEVIDSEEKYLLWERIAKPPPNLVNGYGMWVDYRSPPEGIEVIDLVESVSNHE